jgi:signal transduction histidine kinase
MTSQTPGSPGNPPESAQASIAARVRAGLVAGSRGVAFSGLMLAGLALLALLLASLAGVVFGYGFAIVGPYWETGATRVVVLALMTLALFVVIPLLFIGLFGIIRNLAGLTRRLSGEWCAVPIAEPYQPRPEARRGIGRDIGSRLGWLLTDRATWRDLLWVIVNACVGWVLAAAPATMAVIGLIELMQQNRGGPLGGGPGLLANGSVPRTIVGILLLVAATFTAPKLLRGYCLLARTMLAPSGNAVLARRVQHLSQTRTETLDTGAAEIRRIERDLHDGAQARLVAMGMTLDAAGQLIDDNPKAARALLVEARDNSAKALADLRNLVRGIHPPVLADRGLADAVKALALDTLLRIHLASDLDGGRPPAPVESAAYFAVSELLANVSKHAQATQAWVDIRHADGMLKVGVTDDGHGGADPKKGTGLQGIERRLAAFDGVLAIGSPPGGPTSVTVEIPCALSSPKTSSS